MLNFNFKKTHFNFILKIVIGIVILTTAITVPIVIASNQNISAKTLQQTKSTKMKNHFLDITNSLKEHIEKLTLETEMLTLETETLNDRNIINIDGIVNNGNLIVRQTTKLKKEILDLGKDYNGQIAQLYEDLNNKIENIKKLKKPIK